MHGVSRTAQPLQVFPKHRRRVREVRLPEPLDISLSTTKTSGIEVDISGRFIISERRLRGGAAAVRKRRRLLAGRSGPARSKACAVARVVIWRRAASASSWDVSCLDRFETSLKANGTYFSWLTSSDARKWLKTKAKARWLTQDR